MKKIVKSSIVLLSLLLITVMLSRCTAPKEKVTPEEARAIAKEAYTYGFPMIDGYRIIYAYYLDKSDPEYKGPFNTLINIPRVYTPEDKAVQTPNSDTPYSMLGMDLRQEPLVLTIPPIEKERYFSVQLVDLYTFNFDYIGSRTTGNDGGVYMIAGPKWQGETPQGIDKIFRCETEFALAIYRTQLFDPTDLENVIKVQDGYKVQTLSEFLGKAAPAATPAINFPVPLKKDEEKKSLAFFSILNFLLDFCPVDPSEVELMARFAKIGIGAGKDFDASKLDPAIQAALGEGIKDAWTALEVFGKEDIVTGKVTSGQLFGTRAALQNNYLYRFAAAVLGIYGNSKEEAIYLMYKLDATGQPLDGTSNKYVIQMTDGNLPPVHAFWSFTMYEMPSSLLVANPVNRYLVNSPMLPQLKKDPDGVIRLYIQNESPGKDKESNWLPAPKGPFMVVLRNYWPKDEILNGTWKQPPMELVK